MLPPFIALPSALAVDPLLLAVAGRPLTHSATALRQALPGVDAAWLAAAETLCAQHTGEAMLSCRPVLRSALAACLEELESFDKVLRIASTLYAGADRDVITAFTR